MNPACAGGVKMKHALRRRLNKLLAASHSTGANTSQTNRYSWQCVSATSAHTCGGHVCAEQDMAQLSRCANLPQHERSITCPPLTVPIKPASGHNATPNTIQLQPKQHATD